MALRLFTCLCLCLLLALEPSPAPADETVPPSDTAVEPVPDAAWTEAWWGVAGAALCGGGIRLATTVPVIGMNPYVLSATIGGCLLAALDLAT